jgi:O-antigen ligase
VIAVLSLALFLLVIIKTGSRGAFLGLIAMGLYFLFKFNALAKKTRIIAVAAGVAALIAVGGEQYWSMMATLLNPQDDYNWSGGSDSGRMETWRRGMGYMFSHPILGVGVAAYPVAEGVLSPIADRQAVGIGVKWGAAHNSFVQVGAEIGVFGLILFCMLVFNAYRTARAAGAPVYPTARPPDEQVLGQALAGAVIGYLVCGFFLSQAYSAYMFTLYGMIMGLTRVAPLAASIPAAAGSAPVRSRRVPQPIR